MFHKMELYNMWSVASGFFHLIFMVLRFIHAACVSSLFLFISEERSIVCKYHNLLGF